MYSTMHVHTYYNVLVPYVGRIYVNITLVYIVPENSNS